jgi:hypothetical protein
MKQLIKEREDEENSLLFNFFLGNVIKGLITQNNIFIVFTFFNPYNYLTNLTHIKPFSYFKEPLLNIS